MALDKNSIIFKDTLLQCAQCTLYNINWINIMDQMPSFRIFFFIKVIVNRFRAKTQQRRQTKSPTASLPANQPEEK